jgi:YjbE family integral membrane protein
LDFSDPQFWFAVLQIIAIDIVLGGDNAVVIALACRRLAPAQRRLGIIWGTAGAIGLRVLLVFFAINLLSLPYLKLVGAALLLWIGVKLMQPEEKPHGAGVAAATTLAAAVRIIIVADLVMSIDNVIAIAAASKGSLGLVVFGLLVSIPIIVWGSQIVLRFMDRFPMIVTLGAALLGWIAGDLAVSDPALRGWVGEDPGYLKYASAVLGAALVVGTGMLLARAKPRAAPVFEAAAAQPAAGEAEKVLVPVDGSDTAERAVRHVIDAARRLARTPFVELLNVQHPVHGDVTTFVGSRQVEEYHLEEGEKALAGARALLDASGLPYEARVEIGDPAESIVRHEANSRATRIVMGTRGAGGLGRVLLGSVAQRVVQLCRSPVTLVK